MKTYYEDGEIENGKYLLSIDITKDRAGEEGWIYSWDLGVLTKNRASLDYWTDIGGEGYSDEELLESLRSEGVLE